MNNRLAQGVRRQVDWRLLICCQRTLKSIVLTFELYQLKDPCTRRRCSHVRSIKVSSNLNQWKPINLFYLSRAHLDFRFKHDAGCTFDILIYRQVILSPEATQDSHLSLDISKGENLTAYMNDKSGYTLRSLDRGKVFELICHE